jgi:hypothetical protein
MKKTMFDIDVSSRLFCVLALLLAAGCSDSVSTEDSPNAWEFGEEQGDEPVFEDEQGTPSEQEEVPANQDTDKGTGEEVAQPRSPEPVGRNPDDPNPVIADGITYPPRSFCKEVVVDVNGELVRRETRDYDEQGRLRLVQRNYDRVEYFYNARGKLERIEDSEGCGAAFVYEDDLLVESSELCAGTEEGDHVSRRWSYDEQGRLITDCSYRRGEGSERLDEVCSSFAYPTPLSRFEYGSKEPVEDSLFMERHFHEDGRRASIVHHSPAYGGPDNESRYIYDEGLRLLGLESSREAGFHYSFVYNDEGPLAEVAPFGPELTFEPDYDRYNIPGSRVLVERDASGALESVQFYDWQENFVGRLSLQGDACERGEMEWLSLARTTLNLLDR